MPRELVAGALGLGPFVLVVRKDEVVAATVDVEALTEDLERHRRALDVPARPARAPRRRPLGLARLRRLPQREVERAALLLVDLDPRARAFEQIFGPAVRERAVVGQRRDLEVDALPLDHVRVAGGDELGDQLAASAR